jgi:hypothetical protein
MKTRKIFTIDLYDYLSEEKSKVCKNYQDHNKEVIESSYLKDKYEYVRVKKNDEVENFISSNECLINSLPVKYKYQLISDLVRYKYMIENPDSIYIDTDFCIFGNLGFEVLNAMSDSCIESKMDCLAGEVNRNRLFPCNWLMIGSGKEDGGIYSDMYNLLKERLTISEYESYHYNPEDSKWSGKLEDYIWKKLWGYAIPMDLDIRKFSLIPYEYFQACEWNRDWRNANVMKKNKLVGCHFFGFGEGGRPEWDEFVKYYNLEENL